MAFGKCHLFIYCILYIDVEPSHAVCVVLKHSISQGVDGTKRNNNKPQYCSALR